MSLFDKNISPTILDAFDPVTTLRAVNGHRIYTADYFILMDNLNFLRLLRHF